MIFFFCLNLNMLAKQKFVIISRIYLILFGNLNLFTWYIYILSLKEYNLNLWGLEHLIKT